MTAKEAIEILRHEHDYAQLLSYVNQALEMAIKALEKQIPKKAISTYKGHYKGHYKCPTCENYLDITDNDLYVYEIEPPKCCDECGQALEWGEDEC